MMLRFVQQQPFESQHGKLVQSVLKQARTGIVSEATMTTRRSKCTAAAFQVSEFSGRRED
jgi:hypothetical protein